MSMYVSNVRTWPFSMRYQIDTCCLWETDTSLSLRTSDLGNLALNLRLHCV